MLRVPSVSRTESSSSGTWTTKICRCFAACEAFVLASLTEGFGIPVLEAMLGGAPVVCSQTGALPEVAGAAATYFDPMNVEDMAAKIAKTLDCKEPRKVVVERGLAQAMQFDWKLTARETVAVLEAAVRT